MRRHRKASFLSKDPLDRAANVSLPSFNFVEPRRQKTPRAAANAPPGELPKLTPRDPPTAPPSVNEGGVDFDDILYATIAKCAAQLHDPTLTQKSKQTRVWQSLLRHSEIGRFGGGGSKSASPPNRICTAVCLETIRQVLTACGASTLLRDVLVGGLANSIYSRYDPDLPDSRQQQYADVVFDQQRELERHAQRIEELTQEHDANNDDGFSAAMHQHLVEATLVLKRMDASLRLETIAEMLSPFLSDDLFVVLWNTMATSRAMQKVEDTMVNKATILDESVTEEEAEDGDDSGELALLDDDHVQKRAAALANLVLQERARLVLTFWHSLSVEEQALLYKSLQPRSSRSGRDGEESGDVIRSSDATRLKTVLHALEDTYMTEQVHHHRRQASHRKLTLSNSGSGFFPSPPLLSEESLRPEVPQGIAGLQFRRPTMATRKRLVSKFTSLSGPLLGATQPNADESIDNDNSPPLLSIPNVLLGVIGSRPSQLSPQTTHVTAMNSHLHSNNTTSLDQLRAVHEAILRQCERVFDLLCDEEDDDGGVMEHQPSRLDPLVRLSGNIREAKRSLCDLLCMYLEPADALLHKFNMSEAALEKKRLEYHETQERDANGISTMSNDTFVQTMVRRQKQNPSLLVSAINQSPEILLSAVAQNLGILRFLITKFANPVKRFLKLDPKACDHLDALTQKNKGVQLLWGTNTSSADTAIGVGNANIDGYLLPSAGGSGDTGNAYLVDWFTSHGDELAALFLRQPELLKQLFVDMHQLADVSSFYKLMVQLQGTRGVQNFMRRASVATLERIAQEDPGEILRLLHEVFQHADGPNHDLLDQLRSSPYLVTCLSEFHATALQDVLSSHIDTWKHYFVDAAASNDGILRESLLLRTENMDGGDALIKIFDAVTDGTTAALNLQSIDFASTPSDIARAKERESSTRRKMQQCLYLRGIATVFRAFISPQIASVGYHPRRFLEDSAGGGSDSASFMSSSSFYFIERPSHKDAKANAKTPLRARGKPRGGNAMSPTKKRQHRSNHTREEIAEIAAAAFDGEDVSQQLHAAVAPLPHSLPVQQSEQPLQEPSQPQPGINVPSMWQTYLRAFYRHQSDKEQQMAVPLTKAHVKTLILDMWLEFLKADHLQLENACLWTIAPFVCDYFLSRYDSPTLVGSWLYSFVEGLLAYPEDPRIAFFSTACGLTPSSSLSPGYDVFLYYLHALGHIFFGHMKIFKAENRLEETDDGGCPVQVRHVVDTAKILFGFTFTTIEMRALQHELEALPAATSSTQSSMPTDGMQPDDEQLQQQVEDSKLVELDDVMAVFLAKWSAMNQQVDERYRHAFEAVDTGSNRIGLDQFIQIVTSVTNSRISPRECRLVFGDVGHEFLDLDTLLRVTRAYQLRLFNIHLPEVSLQEQDLHDLRLSVGRTNISSVAREVEDLVHCWRSVRGDLMYQLDASHQSKATKALLRKQNALIERLLNDIQQDQQTTSQANGDLTATLTRAWQEIRACVKMLHAAKLTQHYLSRLFLQFSLVKWVRQARRRTIEDERHRTLEQLTS